VNFEVYYVPLEVTEKVKEKPQAMKIPCPMCRFEVSSDHAKRVFQDSVTGIAWNKEKLCRGALNPEFSWIII